MTNKPLYVCLVIMAVVLFYSSVHAQQKIKTISANAVKLSIRDGDSLRRDYWTITPTARPDIYQTVVTGKEKIVTFITDIDSINFKVRSGKTYGFVILLNGKDSAFTEIHGLAPVKEFSANQLRWVRKNSAPVLSSTAGSGPDAGLELFGKIIGNAQLVSLGESTHGTSEFFTMKHRLLEYAVTKLGFRVFAIEDNQLRVEIVNNYVLYGKGSIDKIMYGMFSVWHKQEVKDMISWMRNYNVNHPDKMVEFVGFDMQNPALPIDSLLSFLRKKDPSVLEQVQPHLASFIKEWPNEYQLTDSVKKRWVAGTTAAWELLQSKKESWMATASLSEQNDIAWAIQNARVLQQCALSKYLGFSNILYRDSAMAENVSWILSRRPAGTRMILWAHDFHISRGDDPIPSNNYYGGISMGSWLSKRYGSQYKAFGLETYSGAYTAYPSYTDYTKLLQCTLNNSPMGSLDKELHIIATERKSPGLIFNMTGAKTNAKWLLNPLAVRAGNHVCIDRQYELKYSIPYQFDGIVFIDKTTGSKEVKQ